MKLIDELKILNEMWDDEERCHMDFDWILIIRWL